MILSSFTSCGTWEKGKEFVVYDSILSKKINIPVTFPYGYESDITTAVVSDEDINTIAEKINTLSMDHTTCTAEIFENKIIIYVPTTSDTKSVFMISQTETSSLDVPLNQYKYRYLASDMAVKVDDSSFRMIFPSYLLKKEITGILQTNTEYETQYTFEEL